MMVVINWGWLLKCVGGRITMSMMVEQRVDMLATRGQGVKMTEANGMGHLCGRGPGNEDMKRPGRKIARAEEKQQLAPFRTGRLRFSWLEVL